MSKRHIPSASAPVESAHQIESFGRSSKSLTDLIDVLQREAFSRRFEPMIDRAADAQPPAKRSDG